MNNLDFEFEDSALSRFLDNLRDKDTVNAYELLALLEGEVEEAVEDAFLRLQELTVELDMAGLPVPQFSGDSGVRLKWEKELADSHDLLRKLEENDPLHVYLAEIAAIPVCGDIRILAEDLAEANRRGGSVDSLCEKIINLSLSRVVELACGYTGWGVFLLDLIQEGSLGLWQVTQGYTGTGADFEAVRDWWIAFYMKKAVILQARESGVGQKLRTALEDYRDLDEKLLYDLGRNPTLEEIAEAMHMTPESAATIGKMVENARLLQSAKREPDPEEEKEAEQQAVEDTAYFQTRQRVNEMLSGLTDQEAKVIALRFGLEGGLPLSPEDTGRKLGLTPDEVVALETAAMMKMRKQ